MPQLIPRRNFRTIYIAATPDEFDNGISKFAFIMARCRANNRDRYRVRRDKYRRARGGRHSVDRAIGKEF
jgi:hypothetical protein